MQHCTAFHISEWLSTCPVVCSVVHFYDRESWCFMLPFLAVICICNVDVSSPRKVSQTEWHCSMVSYLSWKTRCLRVLQYLEHRHRILYIYDTKNGTLICLDASWLMWSWTWKFHPFFRVSHNILLVCLRNLLSIYHARLTHLTIYIFSCIVRSK